MRSISLDTGTDELLCQVEDYVATITLNRPDKRNALSNQLTPALRSILLEMETNSNVRCAQTEDHKEAVRAFLAKQKPQFQGK